MAFKRALSMRATIVARQCHPWISHALHSDDNNNHNHRTISDEKASSPISNSANLLRNQRFSDRARQLGFGLPSYCSASGFSSRRFMSITISDGSDKLGIIGDVVEVLTDPTMPTAMAAANEVAIATADSFLLVMLLQNTIDAVHYYGGVNW